MDESSLLRDEMLLGNFGGPSAGVGQANPFENILFYDEHIDDDGYNLDLIDQLFLNPKRKPIKVSKERQSMNAGGGDVNFSRIETDEDGNESDSSITQNVTYQALQKIKFPNNMKMGNSRENSPEDMTEKPQPAVSKTHRKSKAYSGGGASNLGFGFSSMNAPSAANLDRDVILNQVIEFFDPIKAKGALSKKKSTGKIKDKGSTQKHDFGNKVPADDSTQEEHGFITFYGFVDKQRFKYNAFHQRWVVLRGFNLYWYRSP